MTEDINGFDAIRRFSCGQCFCEFFMLDGIEPTFCPACGVKHDEVQDMALIPKDLGYYEEPEA
jgi:hypothetical protein